MYRALFFLILLTNSNLSIGQDSLFYEINVFCITGNNVEPLHLEELPVTSDRPNLKPFKLVNQDSYKVSGEISFPRLFILSNQESRLYFYVDSVPVNIYIPSDGLSKAVVIGSEQNDIYISYIRDRKILEILRNELYQKYDILLGNYPRLEYNQNQKDSLNTAINRLIGLNEKQKYINFHHNRTKLAYEGIFQKYLNFYPGTYALANAITSFYTSRDSLEEVLKYKIEIKEGLGYFSDRMILNPVVNEYLRISNSLGKHNEGDSFPNIKLPDSLDNKRYVYDEIGDAKFLLVDFWASWCGPCIQKLDELEKIYTEENKKVINILTISIDSKKSAWINAIRKYKYSWVETWSKPNSPELSDFFIPTLPLNYLLDKNGKIIKINATKDDVLELLISNK